MSRSACSVAALLVGACSLVTPGEETLSSGACSVAEKLCGGTCASRLSPSVGCDSAECAPCDLPHAAVACSGGKCTVAGCELGWADCNAISNDGCETDLRIDTTHCGACDQSCSIPRAVAACVAGRCEPASCAEGFAECDGVPETVCETHLPDDPAHCGACGSACVLPFATKTACVGGACLATACAPGRASCSSRSGQGCETDITADDAHCGACGTACTKAELCAKGKCAPRCHAIRALHSQARLSVKPVGFGVGPGDFTLEAWVAMREPPGASVCGMNESYSVSSVRLTGHSSGVICSVLNPKGGDAASGTALLGGPGLEPGRWTHLACVRKSATLTLYVDGKPVSSGPVATDLVELSPFSIGLPEWATPGGKPGPGTNSLGPLRFSKTARYVGPFVPNADWPVDADSVAQFLTNFPYSPGTSNPLVDEAGGDNLVTDYGGFAPELAEVACGD